MFKLFWDKPLWHTLKNIATITFVMGDLTLKLLEDINKMILRQCFL